MIKLFEFQQKEIRTEIIGSDIWFSGQDVFTILDLTWKGASGLRSRNIPKEWIASKESQTAGGRQKMTFINEQALYMIVFSAQKTEVAIKFTKWVAELLVNIRKSIDNGKKDDIRKHIYTDVQKSYSKAINSKNFIEGGIIKTIEYNQENCILHTGMKPSKVVEIGKALGLKSTETSSAKQVLRTIKPETACSMSLTDKLVSENGISHEIAAETSKKFAEPLFKKLMEIGIDKKELE